MARKKKLLTESEVRRFMTLASMAPVGEARMSEVYGNSVLEREEEGWPPEEPEGPEGLEPEEEPGLEMAPDELEEPVELEPEMEMEPAVDEEVAAELAQGIADVMRDVLGVEVSVEGGEEPGELEEPGEPGELEEPVGLEPEEPPPGGDLGGLEPGEEELAGGRDMRYENEDALVNEVAKRVAARLARENKKTKTIDDLTERIFARLTKK